MRWSSLRKRIVWGLGPIVAAALVAVPGPATQVGAKTASGSGIVCSTNPTSTFTLTAKPGYVIIPDGNSIFMWSLAEGNNGFQLPGPTLCVNQGDTVTIVLVNTLPEDSSLIFPGQEDVQANGALAQPQFNGGVLTSLVDVAAKNGGSMTYRFVAKEPGTYLYESGTDPGKQVQMGLFGALIVRPTGHPDWAYNRADTAFNTAAEYVMIFSEVDPDLHRAIERGQPYDVTAIHPRYWMIDGRSFPDTIAPNGAAWLPTQPYGALVHMRPKTAANPLPALIRYLNVGMLNHPFHPHGESGRVIARDGRLLQGPANQDLSYEKFLILVGAGQTWDATYAWSNVEGWDPNSNPIPVTIPQQQNLTIKDGATWFSGSAYLGVQDDLPTGTTSYNQCGEYYHVMHSHALNEAANYEAGFGGMFTLERVDPPLPNTCP